MYIAGYVNYKPAYKLYWLDDSSLYLLRSFLKIIFTHSILAIAFKDLPKGLLSKITFEDDF